MAVDARGAFLDVAPWFRRRRTNSLLIALALYAVVFAARSAIAGTTDALTVFFVVPVAMVALSYGLRGGVAAAAGAIALIAVWKITRDVDLTPLGWASRVLPQVLIGAVVGAAADRLETAATISEELLTAQRREDEAAQIHDSIVQGMAVAKWLAEEGEHERSVARLGETLAVAQRLVADLMGDRDVRGGSFRRETSALDH